MAIKNLNPGRQYGLALVQPVKNTDLAAATAVAVANLPRDAIITSGFFAVEKAFAASTKIKMGFVGADAVHGDLDVASVGVKQLTLTGTASDKPQLVATLSAASATGEGTLVLTYVMPQRANEVHP